jgi:hypothetical protein
MIGSNHGQADFRCLGQDVIRDSRKDADRERNS